MAKSYWQEKLKILSNFKEIVEKFTSNENFDRIM